MLSIGGDKIADPPPQLDNKTAATAEKISDLLIIFIRVFFWFYVNLIWIHTKSFRLIARLYRCVLLLLFRYVHRAPKISNNYYLLPDSRIFLSHLRLAKALYH